MRESDNKKIESGLKTYKKIDNNYIIRIRIHDKPKVRMNS